jgi:hypothetical protein
MRVARDAACARAVLSRGGEFGGRYVEADGRATGEAGESARGPPDCRRQETVNLFIGSSGYLVIDGQFAKNL